MVILLGDDNSFHCPGEPDGFWFVPLRLVPCELQNGNRLVFLAGYKRRWIQWPVPSQNSHLRGKQTKLLLRKMLHFPLFGPFKSLCWVHPELSSRREINTINWCKPKTFSLELASVTASVITADLDWINLYEKFKKVNLKMPKSHQCYKS